MKKAAICISIFLTLSASLGCLPAIASETGQAVLSEDSSQNVYLRVGGDTSGEMATGMRSNGLIYVVVGVVVIILAGVFLYLILVDRRITLLEKEMREKEHPAH